MPKWACRKDSNQNEIAEVFAGRGYSVVDTSRLGDDFPDMIVAKDGQTALIEVKSTGGSLSAGQQDFIEAWQGRVYVCRSRIEALALIQEIEA